MLSEAGFEVFEAACCSEAESVFKQQHPQIVIKDLYMPDWDVFESIRFFKRLDSKVKIIICSTDTSKSMIIEGLRAGAYDFIIKPVDKMLVLRLIRKMAI